MVPDLAFFPIFRFFCQRNFIPRNHATPRPFPAFSRARLSLRQDLYARAAFINPAPIRDPIDSTVGTREARQPLSFPRYIRITAERLKDDRSRRLRYPWSGHRDREEEIFKLGRLDDCPRIRQRGCEGRGRQGRRAAQGWWSESGVTIIRCKQRDTRVAAALLDLNCLASRVPCS